MKDNTNRVGDCISCKYFIVIVIAYLAGSFVTDLNGNTFGDMMQVQQVVNNVEEYQIELYNRYTVMMDRLDTLESYHEE